MEPAIDGTVTMMHITCSPQAVEALPGEIESFVEENDLELDGEVLASGETVGGNGFVALMVQGKSEAIPQEFLDWLAGHEAVSDCAMYELPAAEEEGSASDQD